MTEFEEYQQTGMLGGYQPNRAILRKEGDGSVATIFRDTMYQITEDGATHQREMLVGDKRFLVTSVFPIEPTATPTDKMLAVIDAGLKKDTR